MVWQKPFLSTIFKMKSPAVDGSVFCPAQRKTAGNRFHKPFRITRRKRGKMKRAVTDPYGKTSKS